MKKTMLFTLIFTLLCCHVAYTEEVVEIPDQNLEAVIREAIGKPEVPITKSDLEGITKLEAPDNDIRDITGIEGCVNIERLVLGAIEETNWKSSNEIEDISLLGGLTKLTVLNLNFNKISDITPLSNLTNLTELRLARNQITDITPLSNLTNLTKLFLDNNKISGLTSMSNLTNLTALILSDNQISQITSLSNLTNLTELYLQRNQISDISPLTELNNLKKMSLGRNQINDISALSGLDNLALLILNVNQINDVSSLSGLDNLTVLAIGDNQISDISTLARLNNLTEVYLQHNQISDISPLSAITNLQKLWLPGNQISNTSPLSELDNLTLLNLSQNQINDIQPLVENKGLAKGDKIDLQDNPLNEMSINTHIPELRKRGVDVVGQTQKDICIQHLKEIGRAFEEFKEENGDIPNWLSDLSPKYLQEPNTLLCPADTAEKSKDPKMPCSYSYEFRPVGPVTGGFSPLRGRMYETWKDWKTSQMKEFGDKVSIVRCGKHSVNLSYGGGVYESSPVWEMDLRASKRVKLEHKIKKGDRLNYKLDGENYIWVSSVNIPMIQQREDIEGNATIEVVSVDEEAGTIEIKSSTKQTATVTSLISEEAQTQTTELPEITFKLTKAGHVTGSDIGEFQPSIANLLQGDKWLQYIIRQIPPLITLPEQEVGVGDTWANETSIKSPDSSELKLNSKATVFRFTEINGQPCAVIGRESNLPISVKLFPDVSGFAAEGSINYRTMSYFDYEAGKELRSWISLDIQVTIQANIYGRKATIPIASHMIIKTKLQ